MAKAAHRTAEAEGAAGLAGCITDRTPHHLHRRRRQHRECIPTSRFLQIVVPALAPLLLLCCVQDVATAAGDCCALEPCSFSPVRNTLTVPSPSIVLSLSWPCLGISGGTHVTILSSLQTESPSASAALPCPKYVVHSSSSRRY